MSDLIPHLSVYGSHIRKEWHENEWYYCVIDVFAKMLNTDRQNARNHYHVLKNRLAKTNETVPCVQRKVLAEDGKMRYTDFMNEGNLEIVTEYVFSNLKRRRNRVEKRKDDEVLCLHPRVIDYLEKQGWQVEHHVRLPSGPIIDIVAHSNDATLVVECKNHLSMNKFYSAVGQTLCYQMEYSPCAVPAIAYSSSRIPDYARQSCIVLGIQLILVE